MKKEICPKCKQLRYPHRHHILPRVLFGNTKLIYKICSDCHTDYHKSLGRDNLMTEQPAIFYVKHFVKWMGIIVFIYLIINAFKL
jgi:hypothetical protein